MSRFIAAVLLLAALLLPLTAAAMGTVPKAANSIASQMDAQLMMRYGGNDPQISTKEQHAVARANVIIMGTTPANLNNLEKSSPLARQMTEEISRWLVNAGYRFQELRKGKAIRFHPVTGELLLTRDVRQLASTQGTSQAVLAGTYVVTPDQVRFSMRLIHTTSNEVLAMGTATVPITEDIAPLVNDLTPGDDMRPSTNTRLQ